MGHRLRVNKIVAESAVDGPGLRFAVFMQGCKHSCKGCHNPETHALEAGYMADAKTLLAEFDENPLLAGMTLSGGEPFLQAEAACYLAEHVRKAGKDLVIYTGYLCEDLITKARTDRHICRLLELADILVDGPYQQDLRSLELDYRGSSNQRVLVQKDIHALMQLMVPYSHSSSQRLAMS